MFQRSVVDQSVIGFRKLFVRAPLRGQTLRRFARSQTARREPISLRSFVAPNGCDPPNAAVPAGFKKKRHVQNRDFRSAQTIRLTAETLPNERMNDPIQFRQSLIECASSQQIPPHGSVRGYDVASPAGSQRVRQRVRRAGIDFMANGVGVERRPVRKPFQ